MKQLKGQQQLFTKRGGPRENSGRPPSHPSGRKKPVTVSLSPEAHRILWSIARANHDGNRSAAVEEALAYFHKTFW